MTFLSSSTHMHTSLVNVAAVWAAGCANSKVTDLV
jgi:hypothetical protein